MRHPHTHAHTHTPRHTRTHTLRIGIAHLDVKPENILLRNTTPPLHAMLTDFGSAVSFDPATPSAMIDGDLVGTPVYVAPEIVNKRYCPPQADMWSTGMTMHSLLSGDLHFDAPYTDLTLHRVLSTKIVLSPAITQRTSTGCQNFLQRLLRRDPAKRMTSAEAVAHPWIVALGKLDEAMPVLLADEPLVHYANTHQPHHPLNNMSTSTIAILTTTTSTLVTSVVTEASASAASQLDAHITQFESHTTTTQTTLEQVGQETAEAFTQAVDRLDAEAVKTENELQHDFQQMHDSAEQKVSTGEAVIAQKVDETVAAVENTAVAVDAAVDNTATAADAAVNNAAVAVDAAANNAATAVDAAVNNAVVAVDAAVNDTAAAVDAAVNDTAVAVDAAANTTISASGGIEATTNRASVAATLTVGSPSTASVISPSPLSSTTNATATATNTINEAAPCTNARPLSAASTNSAISTPSESSLSSNDCEPPAKKTSVAAP